MHFILNSIVGSIKLTSKLLFSFADMILDNTILMSLTDLTRHAVTE